MLALTFCEYKLFTRHRQRRWYSSRRGLVYRIKNCIHENITKTEWVFNFYNYLKLDILDN